MIRIRHIVALTAAGLLFGLLASAMAIRYNLFQ